jgi:lipid A ethanolaminephosphotransferase
MSFVRPRFQGLTGNALLLMVAAFIVACGNLSFFIKLLRVYPLTAGSAPALLSLVFVLLSATVLIVAPFCFRHTTKPILIVVLLLSAITAYFMDGYGIVIDADMLENVVQTNPAEARDLLNFRLLGYLAVLGVAPAVFVAGVRVQWRGWPTELLARLKLLVLAFVVLVGSVLAFGSFYASFVREHKVLRSYVNPGYPIYSVIKLVNGRMAGSVDAGMAAIGVDARIPAEDIHRELIILVVGETARADRFSLNGYARETNPQLRKAGAMSFDNFWACGTSTAVSVPCMFSLSGMAGFDAGTAARQENLLDVLQHAGVNVLWLDNNSDSKGVALRVPYESYKSPAINPVCDEECRDEGMLEKLQGIIDAQAKGDVFIVLHQMGNHGPAYFKRYPPAFEKFQPACRSADLNQCTRHEIDNAYDNAILYTDYFLGRVIDLLKRNDAKFETAMLYVGDHGESLGEGGVYLHGLPRSIAPDAQLHVPAVMWLGVGFADVDLPALLKKRGNRFTHDNLFHTALGFMEVKTSVYRPELDILDGCRKPES